MRVLIWIAGIAIAVIGVAVATLGPVTWFDQVLAQFIGGGGHAHTTVAQRVSAAAGAPVAAISLVRWGDGAPRTLTAPPRWRIAIAAAPFLLLLAVNVSFAGAMFRWWRWPRAISEDVLTIGAALMIAGSLVVIVARESRPGPASWHALLFATGCGVGYGCFSGLWHCCPPLWRVPDWSGGLAWGIWLLALTLSLGAVGRVAASWSTPFGELAGALLFGCFYPWHTPAWFAQCLIAGAFATWMVRVTASAWAPALFLGTAYVTHMTLPFIGWAGTAIAIALLALHVLAVRRWPIIDR